MPKKEGAWDAKFIQLMRQHGYNKDIDLRLATIISPPPNLKVKVDNMKIELDRGDLIVAEYLTAHSRQVVINDGAESTIEFKDELAANDRVIVAVINNGQSYVIIDKAVVY